MATSFLTSSYLNQGLVIGLGGSILYVLYKKRNSNVVPKLRINFDQDLKIMPTTRLCFYCCKEGKEHPIEHFVEYPCCGKL